MEDECTTKGPIFCVESMQGHPSDPCQPLPQENTYGPIVHNMRADRRNGWTCALGVTNGQKCVGNDTRKAAEMRSSGAEFLPFDWAVGGKAHRGGNGDLGDSGLVHLERQEQVLF